MYFSIDGFDNLECITFDFDTTDLHCLASLTPMLDCHTFSHQDMNVSNHPRESYVNLSLVNSKNLGVQCVAASKVLKKEKTCTFIMILFIPFIRRTLEVGQYALTPYS